MFFFHEDQEINLLSEVYKQNFYLYPCTPGYICVVESSGTHINHVKMLKIQFVL